MIKRNFRNLAICFVLCLTLTVGITDAVLASSGSISFGGATISWNTTSTQFKATLKNDKVADMYGILRIRTNDGDYIKVTYPSSTTKIYNFTLNAEDFLLVSSSSNYFTYYINNNEITTFNPLP